MRFLFLLLACFSPLCAKEIVFTFDNLPILNSPVMDHNTRTAKFLKALGDEKIKTVFFAIGSVITKASKEKLDCLNQIMAQGHRIANHSYTHPHLSAMTVEEYVADVLKCTECISSLPTYSPWFRYPFLDVGLDPMEGAGVDKAIACAKALGQQGLLHGYITIDSFDWFIDGLLTASVKKGKTFKQEDLENYYVDHLRRTIDRYLSAKSDLEKSLFTKHVILFHANDLNALCLPKVIALFKEEGWKFVPPEDAFNTTAQLADFAHFITFKVKQLTMDDPQLLHSDKTTTEEFNQAVLHEPAKPVDKENI